MIGALDDLRKHVLLNRRGVPALLLQSSRQQGMKAGKYARYTLPSPLEGLSSPHLSVWLSA